MKMFAYIPFTLNAIIVDVIIQKITKTDTNCEPIKWKCNQILTILKLLNLKSLAETQNSCKLLCKIPGNGIKLHVKCL